MAVPTCAAGPAASAVASAPASTGGPPTWAYRAEPSGRSGSGSAKAPAIRTNPQRNAEAAAQWSPMRRRATDSWTPRTDSGSTSRPAGPSWSSQAGAMSHAPAVTMTRSNGAPPGSPKPPSAQRAWTDAQPAALRLACARATRPGSMSMVTTPPPGPTMCASTAAL